MGVWSPGPGATNGDDTYTGDATNETVIGLSGNDTLSGAGGNDYLYGGFGYDTLIGGLGNDTYATIDVFDTIIEQANEGIDTVEFRFRFDSTAFSLAGIENVENLHFVIEAFTLGTTPAISATGNALNNVINVELIHATNDIFDGGAGDDTLSTGTGDDLLIGGSGGDVLNGGAGSDTASYETASAAVHANLGSAASNAGDAAGDSYIAIENLVGSAFSDTLVGDSGANVLNGGGGDDLLLGGDGADTISGGDGFDTLSYAGASAGVIVRLWNGAGTGGTAQGDLISGVENVTGGNGADSLIGSDAVANVLTGGAGNDYLEGRSGDDMLIGGAGGDHMVGGDGVDTLSYDGSTLAVTIRLWNDTASGGNANGDKISGIENVIGSGGSDALIGSDAVANVLSGGAGNDYLEGRSGDDTLLGGAGGDKLVGGDGVDTISYESSSAAVTVKLWNMTASGGDAQGDTLSGIENIIGGHGNDGLIGSDNVGNILVGGDGADYLEGRSGDDTLDGGAGADKLAGGVGNDSFVLTAGQANGDIITDFAGNGASAGDVLTLSGYGTAGAGAQITQIDATHWQIVSADGLIHDTITLANAATLDPSDYIFGP